MCPLFISQVRIIRQTNKHLKKINQTIQLNKDGICNGLVYLFLEYFLLNQKEKFFKDLELLIEFKNPDEALALIMRLLTLFRPEVFSLDFSQSQSYELLHPASTPTFKFAAVMSDEKWDLFFQKFNLQQNEMIILGSIDHVVNLRRENSDYVLYDPNALEGEIHYKNILALINALKKVFPYHSLLGLRLQVFNNGLGTKHVRDKKELYDLINSKSKIMVKNMSHDSLSLSVQINDPDCLFQLSDQINFDTLYLAVIYKSDLIVNDLLTNYKDKLQLNDELIKKIIYKSLVTGSQKIFNALLKHPEFLQVIQSNKQNDSIILVNTTIAGKNLALFTQVLDMCAAQPNFREKLNQLYIARWLLSEALKSKQHQITKKLINFLTIHQISLTEFDKEYLMLQAIASNSLENLKIIMKFAQPENLGRLKVDVFAVYETHPELIQELKQKGVSLTFWQEFCLQNKDSGLLSIIITITMFFMYLYLWACHLINEPRKHIYFENASVDHLIIIRKEQEIRKKQINQLLKKFEEIQKLYEDMIDDKNQTIKNMKNLSIRPLA